MLFLHCGVYLASVYCSVFATGILEIARHQARHRREISCTYSLRQSQVVSHRELWDFVSHSVPLGEDYLRGLYPLLY
jgi:hypothetical protein